MSPHRPRSSMNSDLNKPLPPSPLILEKSNRKPCTSNPSHTHIVTQLRIQTQMITIATVTLAACQVLHEASTTLQPCTILISTEPNNVLPRTAAQFDEQLRHNNPFEIVYDPSVK
ncbi:predicted protein [Plenodomus lingam JN3]|uniref:Predicted protein n=1 Tax=Leptosphaeria maculans (strain JN3 / isolate v23.1.3 / race Av1-4-5-6-7-8) TaxID=985895 RepID=E4ZZX8_LEPMJ|nr:predicted protein [Plenodomus lingam JN3]CBX96838.1 predicted protein [Plenodomus lingam JN3]